MNEKSRARVARALIRWWSRWIQAAYQANCDGMPRLERFFARGGRCVMRIAYPIARRLDPEATTTQMIEEGWWG